MKTTCPHCGQHFEIEQENVGATAKCSSCGKDFVIQILQEQKVPMAHLVQNEYSNTPETQGASVSTEQPASCMKTLTCEMCGSTNLMKQDGVFVCQSCGTKYSVEEAKKMMIAGTVSVAGTVSIDNSEQVKNLLLQGNRFLESEEYEEAENAFSKVLSVDSNNIEAQLGKGIASGWQSDFGKPRYTAVNASMEFLLTSNLPQQILIEKITILLRAFNAMSCTRFNDIAGEYERRCRAEAWEGLSNSVDGRLLAQRHEAEADLKNYKQGYAKFVSALVKSGDKILAKINHDFAVKNFKDEYKETRRLMTYFYSAVLDKEIKAYVPLDVLNVANANAANNLELLKQLDPTSQVQQDNNSGCGVWMIIGVCILFILIMLGSC